MIGLSGMRVMLASTGALLASLLLPGPVAIAAGHAALDCSTGRVNCAEVYDSESVFGEDAYVGHDEPSLLFYSNEDGAGNHNVWQLTLPKDPPPQPIPGRAYNFQLHPAFWFGMAVCDTQSYPLVTSTCTPDSDVNIKPLAQHAGTAFMEMQFYPPGWVAWPPGNSCDATQWCAALNIDSLSQSPLDGKDLNAACQSQVGIEPVNFAFITRSGVPHGPANPVQSNDATFTPNRATDLFMNSGDDLVVTMQDTAHGLRIDIEDRTTGQRGFMTASAANSFGQVKFAPAPSTECTNIPYDFHPMYATSSEQTRVPWAAHSYNVAFADEIGHFDYCSGNPAPGARCPAGSQEGSAGDLEPTDADDGYCFSASESTLVPVSGCLGTNAGFDGVPYQNVWPDGNTNLHPEPIIFSSPLTGRNLNKQYARAAFEADLPRIEIAPAFQNCNRITGANCTLIPVTDDGTPAPFYPFFSTTGNHGHCQWALGNDIPGVTSDDFGRNNQYGSLLSLEYLVSGGQGATLTRFNDFRQVLENPCRAKQPH